MTSPLCPFYLRDFGQDISCSVCPFGGRPMAALSRLPFRKRSSEIKIDMICA